MPSGLGGGVGMAQQVRQAGRGGLGKQVGRKTEEEQRAILASQGEGAATRQLSTQALQAGAVGRARSLKTLGGQRKLGGGLGNRSLSRFRKP